MHTYVRTVIPLLRDHHYRDARIGVGTMEAGGAPNISYSSQRLPDRISITLLYYTRIAHETKGPPPPSPTYKSFLHQWCERWSLTRGKFTWDMPHLGPAKPVLQERWPSTRGDFHEGGLHKWTLLHIHNLQKLCHK